MLSRSLWPRIPAPDDYLTKPYQLEELWARILVQLRHASAAPAQTLLRYRDWKIDAARLPEQPALGAGKGLSARTALPPQIFCGGIVNISIIFNNQNPGHNAANSLYIILFSQLCNLLTTLFAGSVPPFRWPVLALMVAGGLRGGILGRRLNRRMASLRKIKGNLNESPAVQRGRFSKTNSARY